MESTDIEELKEELAAAKRTIENLKNQISLRDAEDDKNLRDSLTPNPPKKTSLKPLKSTNVKDVIISDWSTGGYTTYNNTNDLLDRGVKYFDDIYTIRNTAI